VSSLFISLFLGRSPTKSDNYPELWHNHYASQPMKSLFAIYQALDTANDFMRESICSWVIDELDLRLDKFTRKFRSWMEDA
jgi:hypothetical protein